ncbi:MAG: hypothetical protein JKY89_09660 [Immundisolibacteraceae bacterium]|nr:hypothetical protein [Immundisolibacteraceae bacterium]
MATSHFDKVLHFRVETKEFSAVLKRTSSAAIIGGTASHLAGGKFANGATTASFGHLFNAEGLSTNKKSVYTTDVTDKEAREYYLNYAKTGDIGDSAVFNSSLNCFQADICKIRLDELDRNGRLGDFVAQDTTGLPNPPIPLPPGVPIRGGVGATIMGKISTSYLKSSICLSLNGSACGGMSLPASPKPSRAVVDYYLGVK